MLTVNQLIEALQDLVNGNQEAGELPLRVAMQENWPLHVSVAGVRIGKCDGADGQEGKKVLYFVAGTCPYGENPYASRDLWQEGNGLESDFVDSDFDEDFAVEVVMTHLGLEVSDAESFYTLDVSDPGGDGLIVSVQRDEHDDCLRHFRVKPDGRVREHNP
jgi:hypothetical protein